MVKCVVSGCPNRLTNVNRGIFNRPPKRFFNFPKDPARVKVWLAALREADKQDSTDQHVICEDHFLPEDISSSGVNSDAIPIMPPYLDGPLGAISPWGGEESEGEDQWATGAGEEEEEDEEDEGGEDAPAPEEPPGADPPQQDDAGAGLKASRVPPADQSKAVQGARTARQEVSLGLLTQRFLELLLAAPDGSMDLRHVATKLQTRKRRVYDITNVLDGISLIQKTCNKIKWIGRSPISSFLWKNKEKFESELEKLKLVEDTLDGLIKSCAQQLFAMTDDLENASSAYVTHDDISRLAAFQEQTVIVVKAPEETKMEVPPPTEDSIQVHLKGGRGPIMVLTCDIGTGNAGGCFTTLEESRIKTAAMHSK